MPEVIKSPPKVMDLFPLFTPVPPNVGEIIPDKAILPSKGKPKIFLGVLRVVAVVDVRAVVAEVAVTAVVAIAAEVAKVALIAMLAVFAVRAVMAELAVIAFKAVNAVVAAIAEEAETAVVAVLAFPVRSPTKFEEVTEAKPDKLVYVPPKLVIVDPNVN